MRSIYDLTNRNAGPRVRVKLGPGRHAVCLESRKLMHPGEEAVMFRAKVAEADFGEVIEELGEEVSGTKAGTGPGEQLGGGLPPVLETEPETSRIDKGTFRLSEEQQPATPDRHAGRRHK